MSREELPERVEALMVKVVDDVATPAEREELGRFLAGHPELRRELEDHLALRAAAEGWVRRLELDLAEDRSAGGGLGRAGAVAGTALFVLGLLMLLAGLAHELWTDPSVPRFVALGVPTMLLGLVVLLATALAHRLRTRRFDRYEEVIR